MLIRKTQQPSDFPENQIHDAYSTSTTDTYSCNYINENIKKRGMETIYTGSVKAGSSITLTNVKRFLDVYVHLDFSTLDGMIKYTIDTSLSDTTFGGGMMTPFDEGNMTSYYVSESQFNKANNAFTHRRVGFFNITNGSYTARQDHNSYYVYRIDTYD